jgi:hypothetical protein
MQAHLPSCDDIIYASSTSLQPHGEHRSELATATCKEESLDHDWKLQMLKNIITCLFWTRFRSLGENGQG